MLPTPGTKSTRFDIRMKMKNVVANGKTHFATRLSRMSPITPYQPSTSDSITFCIPVGTSLTPFHVVRRTMSKMTAATIHVQIIEFVTGNPKIVNKVGAADGTNSSAGSVDGGVAVDELEMPPTGGLPGAACEADCAFTAAANIAARNAQ